MISDAEFWIEVRRQAGGGDTIFQYMAAALHTRQVQLDSKCGSLDREEYKLQQLGNDKRDAVDGKILNDDEKRRLLEARKKQERELKDLESPLESNKTLKLPRIPQQRTATISIRVLQQIMMFSVPIYSLRYNIPAMSMSWNTSCFIDRTNKQLTTFGAGQGVKVPQHLCGRGCVAGDAFFAILTDNDEVWASGGLKVSSASINGPTPLGREEVMTGVAGKTLMLVGHGPRLASVTRAFTVRPLSALSNPTRSIIPSRHVRFLDLGYREDYYMVGTDSIVYKTNASKKSVSTPRRVMTLCRTPVSRVASGTSFILVIDQNGHLYTLGRNKKGQLGNGERQEARRKPYLVKSLTHHFFVQVAAGDCHSLALTSNGIVYGAGCNESGQLGLGAHYKEVLNFTHIPLPSKCVGIAAGPAGSMFACEDGQVFTCGLNDCMQLGLETAQKIVYEPSSVNALQCGIESYTMDFGGYRRPDSPYNSDADENKPTEDHPAASENHSPDVAGEEEAASHKVEDKHHHGSPQTPTPQNQESDQNKKVNPGTANNASNVSFAMGRETTLVQINSPDAASAGSEGSFHESKSKKSKNKDKTKKKEKEKEKDKGKGKEKKNDKENGKKKAGCCATM